MYDAQTFSSLLDELYAAAVEPGRWRRFLALLNDSLRGGGATLFVRNPQSGDVAFMEADGFDPAAVAAYVAHYSPKDIWFRHAQGLGEGDLIVGHRLVPRSRFENSEFYCDWLRPYGLYDALGGILLRSPTASAHFSVIRTRDGGLVSDAEIALFRALLPHVRRAVQVHQRLAASEARASAGLQGLDGLGVAVLAVDGLARVVFANAAAEALLRKGDGLWATRGILRAADPATTRRLHRIVADAEATAVGAADGGAGGALALPRRDGRTLSALVCPLRLDARSPGAARPAALVFVADPDAAAPVPEERLAALYGLTRAEARLLRALLEGGTLQSHADASGVSLNTVKTQLRHILGKTGCGRQADLVRHVLSDPAARMTPR